MDPILPLRRRQILSLAGIAPAAAVLLPGPPALARDAAGAAIGNSNGRHQLPGFYRSRVGAISLTIVSDGALILSPISLLATNAPEAELQQILEANYLSTTEAYAHCNALVIESGTERILVDAGGGSRTGPLSGRLIANLAAAGITPDQITRVLLTHAHPDHAFGLTQPGATPEAPEALSFPNARVTLAEAEHRFWTDPATAAALPAEQQPMVQTLARIFATLGGALERVQPGMEIAPGVMLLDLAGHTPGHLGLLLADGAEQVLVTGDAVTHPVISFARPDWAFGFDAEPERAAATRAMLLDRAATDRIRLLSYHCPFPGLGFAARDGSAFRWVPEAIRW